MIPEDDLEHCISEDYKQVIEKMRGQRTDQAFSNYDRFPKSNKFELEALDYNKQNFSVVDVHEQMFSRLKKQPPFVRQMPRTDNFLTPELLKIVEAEKLQKKMRHQRMQQQYNEMANGDDKDGSKYTWSINFKYESHKYVKDLRKMVTTVIDCIKDSTKQVKLSHTENYILEQVVKPGKK